METIRLTLTRPDGTTQEQTFPLEGDLDSLDGIEAAVERFKNQALPKVEKALLEQAQERRIQEEKKTVLLDP